MPGILRLTSRVRILARKVLLTKDFQKEYGKAMSSTFGCGVASKGCSRSIGIHLKNLYLILNSKFHIAQSFSDNCKRVE